MLVWSSMNGARVGIQSRSILRALGRKRIAASFKLEAEEPISHRLVLVDPELAGRARALLPDPGAFTVPARAEPASSWNRFSIRRPTEWCFPNRSRRLNRCRCPKAGGMRGSDARRPTLCAHHRGRRSCNRLVRRAARPILFAVGEDSVAPRVDNTHRANPPATKAPPSAKPSAPTTSPRAFPGPSCAAPSRTSSSSIAAVREMFRSRPTEARVVVPAHWSYKGHRLDPQAGALSMVGAAASRE